MTLYYTRLAVISTFPKYAIYYDQAATMQLAVLNDTAPISLYIPFLKSIKEQVKERFDLPTWEEVTLLPTEFQHNMDNYGRDPKNWPTQTDNHNSFFGGDDD